MIWTKKMTGRPDDSNEDQGGNVACGLSAPTGVHYSTAEVYEAIDDRGRRDSQ